MIASYVNDGRPCLECGTSVFEVDNPVFVENPEADPNVLSLTLPFCSISCAMLWAKKKGYVTKEADD